MATKTSAPLWNIIYVLLAVFVILALLQIFGVFVFTSAITSIINVLAALLVIVVVLHLAGLIM